MEPNCDSRFFWNADESQPPARDVVVDFVLFFWDLSGADIEFGIHFTVAVLDSMSNP